MTRKETNVPALQCLTSSGMATDACSSEKANLVNAQFFKNFNSDNVSTSTCTFRELLNFNFDSTNIPDNLYCSEDEILIISERSWHEEIYWHEWYMYFHSNVEPGVFQHYRRNTIHMPVDGWLYIAPSLKRLFNLSITFRKIPSNWKLAREVLILRPRITQIFDKS